MSAAQHKRDGRLGHACNQLSNGKSGFYVAADRIEQDQHAVDLFCLLDGGDLWNEMLVFGRFVLCGQLHVPFDLADDRNAVYRAARGLGCNGTGFGNIVFLRCLNGWIFLCHMAPPFMHKYSHNQSAARRAGLSPNASFHRQYYNV